VATNERTGGPAGAGPAQCRTATRRRKDPVLGVVAVYVYRFPAFTASSDPPIATYDVDDLREDHGRLLAEARAGYGDKNPDVPVRPKIVHGQPAAVLVAESAGAALTVVGSRGRGGFTGLLLGFTSQSVLHHATRVAIVHAHATDRWRRRPTFTAAPGWSRWSHGRSH
jgi:nucleotide-binding universal stress UspA family protein